MLNALNQSQGKETQAALNSRMAFVLNAHLVFILELLENARSFLQLAATLTLLNKSAMIVIQVMP